MIRGQVLEQNHETNRSRGSLGMVGGVRQHGRRGSQDGGPQEPGRLARPTPGQVDYLGMELQMFVCLDLHLAEPGVRQPLYAPVVDQPGQAGHGPVVPGGPVLRREANLVRGQAHGGILLVADRDQQLRHQEHAVEERQGDVLAELSASCAKHGLKLAVYVYPGDDQWGAGSGSGGRTSDPAKQEAYNKVFRQQLTEVLSRYGEISEVWFDGSCVIEVGDILKQHAPRAMVFQGPHTTLRWVGNEAGYAPYPAWQTVKRADAATGIATAAHSDPDGDVWLPMECDTTLLDHKWFWGQNTDHMLKSLDQLMDIYYKSVGRGCVLLLNSTPDTSGLIPAAHVQRYKEFGDEITRRFGKSLGEAHGQGEIVELDLGQPQAINHVITMEDIREGQRVRAYRLEGFTAGNWQVLVSNGSSVGHKRIDVFPARSYRGYGSW